jgi:adenylate cyclase class 2
MHYEVEQKFPQADLAAIERRLTVQGIGIGPPQVEEDVYYAHPGRDFARTDEALRIRSVAGSGRPVITYKGPKIDVATKTRRELEIELAPGSAGAWRELLSALGFRAVATVRKRRRKAHVPWKGLEVEMSLDEVDGLGSFVELELIATDDQLEAARACLAMLAAALGLAESERRSYLELLLQKQAVEKSP